MLLLLPPSETKRDGGDAARTLHLGDLSFTDLTSQRRSVIAAVRRLGRNRSAMSAALGIGPRLAFEVDRNRTLGSSPTMPAIERYTGVLFDALDAASLSPAGAARARECVVIHSALFGIIRAGDPIPAYRLSHDSNLPDVRLKALWAAPISRELDAFEGVIVDMRSEAYVALGSTPAGENRVFLRVVAHGADGTRRALTHFNKRGKGLFIRAVLESAIRHSDIESLVRWAVNNGIRLEWVPPGELHLVVDEVIAAE